MLGGLASANCLIDYPTLSKQLDRGERVRVQLLSWKD